jgi:hypothetical protein
MRNQKPLAIAVISAFLFLASMAWKASWQSVRLSPPASIDLEINEITKTHKNAAAPFEAPKTSKEAAPAWGSFQVAGVAQGTPISLKYDFNASAKPKASPPPKTAAKKVDPKKKKASVAKVTPAKANPFSKSSDDKKMSPIKDEPTSAGTAVIAVANTPVAPETETKKKQTGRTPQEWEAYLTEDTSKAYARTNEFLQAYATGALNNEDSTADKSWVYGLMQKMFDNNAVIIQQQGLRIAVRIPSDQTFAILVRNGGTVDKSIQPNMTAAIQKYDDVALVTNLKGSMFHYDQLVQTKSLDVLQESVSIYLDPQSQQQAPAQSATQRTAASSGDHRDLYSGFISFLDRLVAEDRDQAVIVKAASLANQIRRFITAPVNQTVTQLSH